VGNWKKVTPHLSLMVAYMSVLRWKEIDAGQSSITICRSSKSSTHQPSSAQNQESGADHALKDLSKEYHKMYSPTRWPPIPPRKLVRAILLQVLYSIGSEQLLLEQLDYNLLFRWFAGLWTGEEVWDQSLFSNLYSAFGCRHYREVLLQSWRTNKGTGAFVQ
jgi:hypothetical protein